MTGERRWYPEGAPKLIAVTMTADRPWCMKRLEGYLHAQAEKPDAWVIVDSGKEPLDPLPSGCTYVRAEHIPDEVGHVSVARNLLRAIEMMKKREWMSPLVIMEDDDWYHPDHVRLLRELYWTQRRIANANDQARPTAVGWVKTVYYDVVARRYARTPWPNPTLAASYFAGMHNMVRKACKAVIERGGRGGVDRALWNALSPSGRFVGARAPVDVHVGLKRCPGLSGAGIAHSPESGGLADQTAGKRRSVAWSYDREGKVLRELLGADAEHYLPLYQEEE